MKKAISTAWLATALCLVGCYASNNGEVVEEAYMHQYGVPLSKKDWNATGGYGKVINKRKDGVTVSQTYSNNQLHGDTTFTYPHSDTLQRIETYDQGDLARELELYSSGTPMAETAYKPNGVKIIKTWYETGTPRSVENFQDGYLVDGQYFNTKNEMESEVAQRFGRRVIRDAYGQLASNDEIEDGLMISRTTFHANGTPKEIIPYQHEMVHGKKRTFIANGEPNTIETWVNNHQNGITEMFRNGEKYAEVPFANGVKHGVEKRFRDGHIVVEEVTWREGRRHGPNFIHLDNGTKTDWFFEGKQVTKIMFDELNHSHYR